MADNLTVTPGAGATYKTDQLAGGEHVGFSKILDGTADSENALIVTAGGAAKVDGSGVTQPVSAATLPLPSGAATSAKQDTQITLLDAQALMLDDLEVRTGAVTETAPANDTASSGLNGRLQRLAQRITSLIALLPAALVAGRLDVNQGGIAGNATSTGNGASGTGVQRVTIASDSTGQVIARGDVAHDAADSGNPVKVGGVARTANPTKVTAADRVDAYFDVHGRQVVAVGQPRELVSHQHTRIDNSTAETTIVTAVASEFHDLVSLVLTNETATAVIVTIKDSTAGTTRMVIALAANGGAVITPSRAIPQLAAVNNNWTATLSATGIAVNIFAQFEKQT